MMAKFVSITAILSHEHEVRFKDGTELRQAIGLALVILLSQLEATRASSSSQTCDLPYEVLPSTLPTVNDDPVSTMTSA